MLPDLLGPDQFGTPSPDRRAMLLKHLNDLTQHHLRACEEYARSIKAICPGSYFPAKSLEDIPFLPVEVFKRVPLKSVPDGDVFTTIRSSGTTGQIPSRVFLDRATASAQARALSRIMSKLTHGNRLPLMIIDRPSELASNQARGLGIRGMLPLSRFQAFVLDENMEPDSAAIAAFLDRVRDSRFLVFGFTFVLWGFLQRLRESHFRFPGGIVIHSGGWKKLESLGITDETLRGACRDYGFTSIHNFYGMAEQTGSVFLQGPDGSLRTPLCADVIVRDPVTLEPVEQGKPGLVQVLSSLPRSYPGHSILTEDVGVILGIDDGRDGWLGTRFRVIGRAPRAELRGCSDVMAVSR